MGDIMYALMEFLDYSWRILIFIGIPAGIIYFVHWFLRRASSLKASADAQCLLDDANKELASLKTQYSDVLDARDKAEQRLVSFKRKAEESVGITEAIVKRLIEETIDTTTSRLTTGNFATSQRRLETLFAFCTKKGVNIPSKTQDEAVVSLKEAYEAVVRKEYAKQEQKRIQEKMREEAREEAERQRELQRIEREEKAIEEALERALRKAKDEHSEEVERLRARLAEAQEKLQRAKSMAELTRTGHIYVISNIGSFGEEVFKIGMTRRLEPYDRVKELGDASVPFPFDVHMMISSDDAPALENAIHKELDKMRLNRVNPRKEFFRSDIGTIVSIVEKQHGKVDYTAEPEALEWRESESMTEEDYRFITHELEDIASTPSA